MTISQRVSIAGRPTLAVALSVLALIGEAPSAHAQGREPAEPHRSLGVDSGEFAPLAGGRLAGGRLYGIDRNTNDLVSRDLATGARRVVTTNTTVYSVGPISPDGRMISFTACTRSPTPCNWELRTIGIDGSGQRTVFAFGGMTNWIEPHDWSPDGRTLLGVLTRRDQRNQITRVSVSNGTVELVRDLEWRSPAAVRFAPDGRSVAYDRAQERDLGVTDLYVGSTDGKSETRITTDGTPKALVAWAADGSGLLFSTATELGASTLWIAPTRRGRSAGASRVVTPGRPGAAGFSSAGASIYYQVATGGLQVFQAPIDLELGRVLSPPKLVLSSPTLRFWAVPSMDGTRIASPRIRISADSNPSAIGVTHVADGREHLFPIPLKDPRIENWSADRDALTVVGIVRGTSARYRISLDTGGFVPVAHSVMIEPVAGNQRPRSPDRAVEYYVRRDTISNENRIVARNVGDGNERILFVAKGAREPVFPSPDGSMLGVIVSTDNNRLMVVAAEGAPRHIFTSDSAVTIGPQSVTWSPDSRHVLLRAWAGAGEAGVSELWSVSMATGIMRRVVVTPGDAFRGTSIQIAKDGRSVWYTVTPPPTPIELWAIDDLPGARPRQRRSP